MEAAIRHLRGDGYKVTLGGLEPTADYLKLDVTWPTK